MRVSQTKCPSGVPVTQLPEFESVLSRIRHICQLSNLARGNQNWRAIGPPLMSSFHGKLRLCAPASSVPDRTSPAGARLGHCGFTSNNGWWASESCKRFPHRPSDLVLSDGRRFARTALLDRFWTCVYTCSVLCAIGTYTTNCSIPNLRTSRSP